jgi:hypothetical protein
MMEEDSKDLANAGSYGVKLHFRARGKLDGKGLASILHKSLSLGAEGLGKDGILLGHVKAIALTEKGFVKVNIVDLRLGADVEDSIGREPVDHGTVNLMAAVTGRSDADVRKGMEKTVSALARQLWMDEGKGDKCTNQILELR